MYRFQAYFLSLFARRKSSSAHSVPVAIVSASLMDSPYPLFHPLSSPPFLLYHIHTFPWGLIKRLSGWGEGKREDLEDERGWLWQCRRVVLITPYVWTEEGGVEVPFQLINRDTMVLLGVCALLCVSLSFHVSYSLTPQTLPLEIMGLVLTLWGLGTMTEIQFCSVKVEFHVKILRSTRWPESSNFCLNRLTVSYILWILPESVQLIFKAFPLLFPLCRWYNLWCT